MDTTTLVLLAAAIVGTAGGVGSLVIMTGGESIGKAGGDPVADCMGMHDGSGMNPGKCAEHMESGDHERCLESMAMDEARCVEMHNHMGTEDHAEEADHEGSRDMMGSCH